MTSIPAQEVAKDLIKAVRNGEIPNMQKIQMKHGYSKKSAKSMKAKETKAFKEATRPIVDALEKERDRIMEALAGKDLSEEKYRDLIDGLDKITKNHQLLTGGKTENTGIGELAEQLNSWINSKK